MQRSRHRAYFITINHYCDDDISSLKALCHLKYIVIGEHVGEKSKIPHIHALLEFDRAIDFRTIKRAVPRGNIEPKRGTAQQARKYIVSGGTIIFETGTISHPGKRDMVSIKADIKKDGKVRVHFDDLTFSQFKSLVSVVNQVEPVRDFKTISLWFCGRTGVGKSRIARELCEFMYGSEEMYFNSTSTKFFSCYDAHESCIIDEFRSDGMRFTDLLRISDRYPCSIEVKGGFRQFLSKILVITSPKSPSVIYDRVSSKEDLEQIERRFIVWYME